MEKTFCLILSLLIVFSSTVTALDIGRSGGLLRSLCPSGCQCLTESQAYAEFGGEFETCEAEPCGTAWEKEFQINKYCYHEKIEKIVLTGDQPKLSLCPDGCECLAGPDAEAKYGLGKFKSCKKESCGEGWVKDLKLKKFCYSPISVEECEDSDGGKNYDKKGDAVGYIDVCSPFDDQLLQEYYTEVENFSCSVKSEMHDCNSICENGRCLPPTCEDWIQNQDEKGVDCGGVCPDSCLCPTGCKCVIGADAEEQFGAGGFVSCQKDGCGHQKVGDLNLVKFCYRELTDCIDPDGGKNYEVKSRIAGVYEDHCSPFDDQIIEEYYVISHNEITGECKVGTDTPHL